MTLIEKQMIFQKIYQLKCEQVLNSLKTVCIHLCSQGDHRKKESKCDSLISAHTLSLEFKSFYGIWSFFKKGEESSPILTTLPHHSVEWSGSERIEVSRLRLGRSLVG